MRFPSLSSEFPNDNPELSEGVVWVCSNVCERALPLRRPEPWTPGMLVLTPTEPRAKRPTAPSALPPAAAAPFAPPAAAALSPAPLAVPAQPAPALSVAPAPEPLSPAMAASRKPSAELSPDVDDAFARFVAAMASTALAAGATRAAAELPRILGEGRLRGREFGAAARLALRERGLLAQESDTATPALIDQIAAWREVLRGESYDLARCGTQTLDEWGAELLLALLGGETSGSADLRRTLRRNGVAAFGMLEAA